MDPRQPARPVASLNCVTTILGHLASLAATLLVGVLVVGWGSAETDVAPSGPASRGSTAAEETPAPVADDLERLAEAFVGYAVGDSDTFPHRESVSISLGGGPVLSIDDIAAALPARKIWKICPADWDVYGAASCPVDLLSPIRNAVANGASPVHSAEYGRVTCAPTRTGPLPLGRLVVLRPSQEWRTCATDFAVVLAADGRGRLRHIDLTLSEP